MYIIQKMILSSLVCFCSLDTGQESYALGDFSALAKQNIEMTPIKMKVGNWQALKLPGSWIRRVACNKYCSLRVEWRSFQEWMGNFCHLQLVCCDMPIICQHPSSRTAHKLSTIKIKQSSVFILVFQIQFWCRIPDIKIKDGFGVCFILVAQTSKQLMQLFRSSHMAKTTFNHTALKYVLHKSFCIILEYICFAIHVIVLADIHAICK